MQVDLHYRVHHLPRIFAAPPGHPTASGFDSIEYVYEIFLNLINVWDMHNAKENSIELDRIDRMSKINFQNMTIFTSYPMYFDALNTNINLKNRKCNILWSFWLQNWSFPPESSGQWNHGQMSSFRAKMATICYICDFSSSYLCSAHRNT